MAQERSMTMGHLIEVTFSKEGEVVTAAKDNPKAGVNRGETVIWSFEVDVAAQKLEVRPKGSSSSFDTFPKPNQISGPIIPNTSAGNSFEYDIFRDGVRLVWAGGSSGGCVKPIGPPTQQVSGLSGSP